MQRRSLRDPAVKKRRVNTLVIIHKMVRELNGYYMTTILRAVYINTIIAYHTRGDITN